MDNSNGPESPNQPAPEPWWLARYHRPLTPDEEAERDRVLAESERGWSEHCRRWREKNADERSRSDLPELTPPEQERYLREIAPPWRDQLRHQYGLVEPLSHAERERVLRDVVCYPEQWAGALRDLIRGEARLLLIEELPEAIAYLTAKGVRRNGRPAQAACG